MGRAKIAIEKLEAASQRRVTFNKRSIGIQKKAKELSILCDSQVLLITSSPSGQYELCLGDNCTFDGVVQHYLSQSQGNQDKSRLGSIEVLKKAYQQDAQVLKNLTNSGMHPTRKKEGSQMRLEHIREEIAKIETRLGPLRNFNEIDNVESLDELTVMENSIMEKISCTWNGFCFSNQSQPIPSLEELVDFSSLEDLLK